MGGCTDYGLGSNNRHPSAEKVWALRAELDSGLAIKTSTVAEILRLLLTDWLTRHAPIGCPSPDSRTENKP